MMKLERFCDEIRAEHETKMQHRYKVLVRMLLKEEEDPLNDVSYEELTDLLENLASTIDVMEENARFYERFMAFQKSVTPICRKRIL